LRRLEFILALGLSLVATASAASLLDDPYSQLVHITPELPNSPTIVAPPRAEQQAFNGGATYSYPILVPPGTGAATPSLSLRYSSFEKGSAYGWGWSLQGLGQIERSTRAGPPNYGPLSYDVNDESSDTFELDGMRLVPDPDEPGTYYPLDNREFVRARFDETNDVWEVAWPDGTKRRYGEQIWSGTRLAHPEDETKVFRWLLDRVTDPAGNFYTVVYEEDVREGRRVELYPSRIRYSNHESAQIGSEQNRRIVEFVWEDRCYDGEDCDKPTSFRSTFRIQTRKRLAEIRTGIEVSSDGKLDASEQVRRYEFTYAPKTSADHPLEAPFSKLISIQRYGQNDEMYPTATEFGYSRPERGYSEEGSVELGERLSRFRRHTIRRLWQNEECALSETLNSNVDINGDGLADWIESGGTQAPDDSWTVRLGAMDASGTFSLGEEQYILWEEDAGFSPDLPDLVNSSLKSFLQFPSGSGGIGQTILVDLDGDGRPDHLEMIGMGKMCIRDPLLDRWQWRRNLSTAEEVRFGQPQTWVAPEFTYSDRHLVADFVRDHYNAVGASLLDLNSDGRPDLVLGPARGEPASTHLSVWFNEGCKEGQCGFGDPQQIRAPLSMQNRLFEDREVFVPHLGISIRKYLDSTVWTVSEIVDLNGDGLPDVAKNSFLGEELSPGPSCLYAGFGLGGAFQEKLDSAPGFLDGAVDCASGDVEGSSTRGFLQSHHQGIFDPPPVWTGVADLNGDGIVDRYGWDEEKGRLVVFGLGDGTFTRDEVEWTGESIRMGLVDVDRDGLIELVDNFTLYMHPGRPGLLTEVTTELGGTMEIEYGSSAQFMAGAEEALESGLAWSTTVSPSHRSVVTKITTWDGREGTAPITQLFGYETPLHDRVLREPFGFRASESEYQDETGASLGWTRSIFHQTWQKKGRLATQMQYDEGGEPVRKVEKIWEFTEERAPQSYFVAVAQETSSGFDAGERAQDYIIERDFDGNTGNLTRILDAGSADPADDLEVTASYAINEDEWLLRYPSTLEESHAGAVVGTTRLSFDGRAWGEAPTAGLLTARSRVFNRNGQELTLTESWEYDAFGNRTTYVDPAATRFGSSPRWTASYDTTFNSFIASITNRLGHQERYAYRADLGVATRHLDPNGRLLCFEHDDLGRLSGRSQNSDSLDSLYAACDEELARFEFVDEGDPQRQYLKEVAIPGHGRANIRTRRFFDGLGREYRSDAEAAPGEFVTTLTGFGPREETRCVSLPFDLDGGAIEHLVCESTTPRREVAFDAQLRPVERALVGAGGRTVESTHRYSFEEFDERNGAEAVATVTIMGMGTENSPNRVRRLASDQRGNAVGVEEEADGSRTLLVLDPRGRVVEVDGPDIELDGGVTDPNQMFVEHDFLGLRTRLKLQGGEVCGFDERAWTFTYDENGNLATETSPVGRTTTYVSDELNRVKEKRFANAKENQSWLYDGAPHGIGRVESMHSRGVDTSFTYALDGTVTSQLRKIGGHEFTFGFVYDRLGRPLSTTYPDGSLGVPAYDGAELRHVHDTVTPVVSYLGYHASGQLESAVLPNGTFTSTFDPDTHRPDLVTTTHGGVDWQSLDFDFDSAGNILRLSDTAPGGDPTAIDFEYDGRHRLKVADIQGAAETINRSYEYDSAGNLKKIGPRTLRTACSPGGPNVVTSVEEEGQDTRFYGYDADGGAAFVSQGNDPQVFLRDESGRLSTVYSTDERTCYDYDVDGQRVSKEVGSAQSHSLTHLYVSADYEVDLVKGEHRRHVFVGDRRMATIRRSGLGSDADPGENEPIETYYHHADHIGTNTVVTTADGSLVQKSLTLPYGEVHRISEGQGGSLSLDQAQSRYLFTDQEHDVETDFVYFGARYYDPMIGRFLSTDPALIGATDGISFSRIKTEPVNLNGHAYALGRPTVLVDPTGAFACDTPLGGLLAVLSSPLTSNSPFECKDESELMFPTGGSREVNDYDTIYVFGVNVDRDDFQSAIDKANANGDSKVMGFYNPTNGLPNDLYESIAQKFFGENDPAAQQFSEALAKMDHGVVIIAHSQGTLTVSNAAQYHSLPEGSRIEFRSPAISRSRAEKSANAGGATHTYSMPPGDIAQLWAPDQTAMPIKGPISFAIGTWIHTNAHE